MRPESRLARRGGAVELLRLPAAVFGAAARLRGSLYDRGWLGSVSLGATVVSVGNLTAGGTGKTPMVAWLAGEFAARGRRVGILSRGYGRGDGEQNDEALLLARLLPDVPHVQDPDRVAGGHELERLGVDVILLDDGFQHRRLARDLDLVLVDATRPWGLPAPPEGGDAVRALLPRGLLREPPAALTRADAALITRVDAVAPERAMALRAELERLAPGLALASARHRPRRLVELNAGAHLELGELAGREVDALSAIGNPEAFEATLEALGARLVERRRLADHQRFEASDLAGLGARPVVVTAKDAVKLGGLTTGVRLLCLEVELEIVEGAGVLAALIDACPPSGAERERRTFHEGLHG